MLKRGGHATWQGTLAQGRGLLTTPSRTLNDAPYSFPTRFGEALGTNPEELIAAAHAGCYSMALSFLLGQAGIAPETIRTTAELSVVNEQASWTVTAIHLTVVARIPQASEETFQKIAEQARAGCLVTRLVTAPVTLEARLEDPATST